VFDVLMPVCLSAGVERVHTQRLLKPPDHKPLFYSYLTAALHMSSRYSKVSTREAQR
jgi:hypothetical protein